MKTAFTPAHLTWRAGQAEKIAQANGPIAQIKIGLGIALLAALTGCVGYVDGGYVGGGYGGAVVLPAPDVYFWGGGYERGHEVRGYSHRGYESRATVYPGRGGPERRSAPTRSSPAHSGGGGHDERR